MTFTLTQSLLRGRDNRLFPTKPTDDVVCGSRWVIVVGHMVDMVQGCAGRAVHELFKMAVRARTDLRDGHGRTWSDQSFQSDMVPPYI